MQRHSKQALEAFTSDENNIFRFGVVKKWRMYWKSTKDTTHSIRL
tara:strand:- start:1493 stop:1627 length:135 start_codon:yes stop_codon:yes gene_type:complete